MSLSTPFIHRPVGTTLMAIAVAAAGILAYQLLPVAPLPEYENPTISVSAGLPGASPQTMANAVATPLERQFGRIAGVTEMTSSSSLGSTNITMQFDLNRPIDAAARDVQAAINAARSDLPSNLPGNPTYRKVNPADAPILIMALTSSTYNKGRIYDYASSILAQKISQIDGVGQVGVNGGALPAVRVDANPTLLNTMGLGLPDIQKVLGVANVNLPKGELVNGVRSFSVETSDQLFTASQYKPLIVAYRNGAAVRLEDVADVTDSVQDIRQGGVFNGKPAVLLFISRQPGANIIATVDRVLDAMPLLKAQIPANIQMDVVVDRSLTIRASVHDTRNTLLVSIGLVILVVFLFLRDGRTTLIPSVAVPLSLIGTFGVMYLVGYSIDNLSLMALTIATGFVVDDAIVVVENITRHMETGMRPLAASLLGAKEIGFTVLSMSISLMAVFIPILLMGGVLGRMFREFAVVLSVAIGLSLIVSLTLTPMMAAHLLKPREEQHHGWFFRSGEIFFNWSLSVYQWILRRVIRHPQVTLTITLLTIIFTVYLYVIVPKGIFPQQDIGRIQVNLRADQSTSFQAMTRLQTQFVQTVLADPAVESMVAFAGSSNTAGGFIQLKPTPQRKETVYQVIDRLRRNLSRIPGALLFMQAQQDLHFGGRQGNAQFQYTLQGDTFDQLQEWAPKVLEKLKTLPGLADVNSDQQSAGLESMVDIDRATASRLGVSPTAIDNTLYDAFGQAQVSTMYRQLNQYHVVLEAQPQYLQGPAALNSVYVHGTNNVEVPLSAVTHFTSAKTPLSLPHQGQFPSTTITFNLLPGVSLSDVVPAITAAENDIGLPATIHGSFQGAAQIYQDSLSSQPILIAAAILAVYIVLGILYESFIHPITILSTIPSAGVGALLAMLIFNTELDIIGTIGIILLIGLVKKNAIMMIDFALHQERTLGLPPADAIYQACLLRFRPIMMTTMAALLGGLPLALGTGVGSEIRRPLGIAIVGGLLLSQPLTLFTTPVVYLYLDRFRHWTRNMLGFGAEPSFNGQLIMDNGQ